MIFISERLDFKDKFIKTSDGSVLFLQNKIIKANSSIQWNTKLQGYLENNNPQSANIIINSGYGSLSKTLKPYEKFQFPYININSITNSSSVDITVYFSNSEFGFFATQTNTEITNETLNVVGSVDVSGSVLLTNDSVNISGSVEVSNTINANITGSVELTNDSINVSGSVLLTNDSVNISGSVNINNTVSTTGTVEISNTINTTGTVEISNQISGTVNIANEIQTTGTVEISNSISGTVNIANNINGTVNIGNAVNVNGTVNVSNQFDGTVNVANAITTTGTVEVSNQFDGSVSVVNEINGSINIQSQADALSTNESFSTFLINCAGYTIGNYTGSYITSTITLSSNSVMIIKDIIAIPGSEGTHDFSDDLGLLQLIAPAFDYVNDTTNTINMINFNMSSSIPIKLPYLKNPVFYNAGNLIIEQTNTGSANNPNGSGNNPIYITYKRKIVNTTSSNMTIWIQMYLKNGAGNSTTTTDGFLIYGEISGSYSFTVNSYNAGSSSSSSGSGSGSGGGCFTSDTEFYGEYKGERIVKKFSEFKEGDMILTINGFEPIEKIYDTGIQPVYIIDDNLKISETQPFIFYDGGKEYTILDKPDMIKDIIIEHTYDIHVKSLWIIPVSNKVYSLCDIIKKTA